MGETDRYSNRDSARPESVGTCSRRTVLSAIAGGTALAASGAVTGNEQRPATVADFEQSTAAPADPLDAVALEAGAEPATIEGAVTVPPKEHAGSVVVGTERGVYTLEDGEIEQAIQTRPVRTLTPLTEDRIGVVVEDEFFPNVVVLDISQGERLWATGREQRVYNHERGFEQRQVGALDIAPLSPDDSTSGALVVATGYGLAAYDEDGDLLWEHEHDYYTLSVTVEGDTVYAGTQDGRVLALDVEDGGEQFAVTVTEPFDGIPRAVWDVAVDDGNIIVSTEDGYLKQLDDDGEIVWEASVLEFDEDDLESYYRGQDGRPTMPGNAEHPPGEQFDNVELVITDRGYIARTREPRPGGPGDGRRDAPGEVVFVSREGEVNWRNDAVDLELAGNIFADATVDPDHVFVPSGPVRGEQEVTKLDLDTGSEADTLVFPARPGPTVRRDPTTPGYLGAYGDQFVVTSETGDVLVAGADETIEWSVPSLADGQVHQADFLGDGTEDYLVYTLSQFEDPREQFVTAMVLRSGTDGSVVWSWYVDVDDIRENGGLQALRVARTADSGIDLLAVEAVPVPRDRRDQTNDLERELRQL